MTPQETTPSPRDTRRLDWVRSTTGLAALDLRRASVDAGFRSYWRTLGETPSHVVMDSPPDQEDVRPWLRMRDLLEGGGVRVPRVLAHDVEQGFLLLEDLGGPTLAQVIDDGNADAHFDGAIEQLLRLQAIAPPAGTGEFGEALLQRDADLFEENFWKGGDLNELYQRASQARTGSGLEHIFTAGAFLIGDTPARSRATRSAKTSPSSSEFDANRFAPCTPVRATSSARGNI